MSVLCQGLTMSSIVALWFALGVLFLYGAVADGFAWWERLIFVAMYLLTAYATTIAAYDVGVRAGPR